MTAKMLVCLSSVFVVDSVKVKTAAVAERCDCETRLRGEASRRRWCAAGRRIPTRLCNRKHVSIPSNCHNMCHQISDGCNFL